MDASASVRTLFAKLRQSIARSIRRFASLDITCEALTEAVVPFIDCNRLRYSVAIAECITAAVAFVAVEASSSSWAARLRRYSRADMGILSHSERVQGAISSRLNFVAQ
jgi:hypothetical protein